MNAVIQKTGPWVGPGMILALALLACAHAAPAADPAQESVKPGAKQSANVVQIANFSFSPQTLTVAAGTSVTWINRDDEAHTVTSAANPRLFNSPPLDTGDQFSFTFAAPGTYQYFCAIHPHMVGVVVVK